MNIVLIGPVSPARGGYAIFDDCLARQLMAQGHRLSLVPLHIAHTRCVPDEDGEKNLEGASFLPPLYSHNPFSWFRVTRVVLMRKPDLLILRLCSPHQAYFFARIVMILGLLGKIKVRVIADDVPNENASWFTKRCVGALFSRSEAVVALSSTAQKNAVALSGGRPVLSASCPVFDCFPPAIPREEAIRKLGLPLDSHYVLYFGQVDKNCDLKALLYAMDDARLQDLPGKGGPVRLIVVGNFSENVQNYISIIRDYDLDSRVLLLNRFVSMRQVSLFFSAADLVVLPNRKHLRIGVSRIALAFRRPMVVTAESEFPELTAKSSDGVVILPKADDFADAIVSFLSQDNPSDAFSALDQAAQRLTWDAFVETLLYPLK